MKYPSEPNNRRILVIDDNHTIHDDFRKILVGDQSGASSALEQSETLLFGNAERPISTLLPFEIDSAFQGQEGLEMVRRALDEGRPYAMAFVDIRMPPGWDGIKTIAWMWEAYPELQVVICTAYSDYSWSAITEQLGHTDRFLLLKKPFDNIEVLQLASAVTEKWNLGRQLKEMLDSLEEKVKEKTVGLEAANKKIRRGQTQLLQSEKMASIGQLAAGVAHEINNPVGFVMSNLRTLTEYVNVIKQVFDEYDHLGAAARRGDTTAMADILERVDGIRKEEDLINILEDVDPLLSESIAGTDRVKEIVQSLKSFARLDEGRIKEVNINECIDTTLKVIWNELKYKCQVHKKYGDIPSIQCYPGQINQVFMNLVHNAVQAIPERGDITIETSTVASYLVIRISDTGMGILPENLPKLFDPFFTTKEVGKGTGLGLSISHGIIEKHNGTIEMESEIGKGTTFIIQLPLDGVQEE